MEAQVLCHRGANAYRDTFGRYLKFGVYLPGWISGADASMPADPARSLLFDFVDAAAPAAG